MSTQRITISLPQYLYQKLRVNTEPRMVSSFVTNIIEREIMQKETLKEKDPINDFLGLRSKLKERKDQNKILDAIRKGRI